MFFGTDDAGLEKLQKEFLEINNLVIEGQPEDLVINTHICRELPFHLGLHRCLRQDRGAGIWKGKGQRPVSGI